MSRLAIIPARGGSKRIPGKNIKPFHGKPMLAYSIEAAQASGLFTRIVVSTDDLAIAQLALQLGAEVPFSRPAHLADDHATTLAVMQHAVATLAGPGTGVEYVCCVYATAPFIQAADLQRGFALLAAQPSKSYAFSVTDFAFPVQRAIRIDAQGAIAALYPQYREVRSQDLEPAFHDAGQFYWGRTAAWLRADPLFSALALPVVLPRYLVQDIDTPHDWRRAELMYQALLASGEISV
jgi:pseudaminic acid cytidylyltransferase